MKQLKVSLPDEIRDQLERTAEAEGTSLGEVVRRRLELGFKAEEADQPTRDLMDTVKALANMIERDTGRPWYLHRAASGVLLRALVARFARWVPQEGEAQFKPEELPTAGRLLMGATEVETIALALEALEAQQRYRGQGEDQEQQAKKRGQAA
jgi:hypothetical protein